MKTKAKKPKISVQSDVDYMSQSPSRGEIATYVQSILDNYYMPLITSQIQLSSVIIQGILLEKKICTSDEMKDIASEFIREHKFREMTIKNQDVVTELLIRESQLDIDMNTLSPETSLYTRLQAVEKLLSSEVDYHVPEDLKAELYDLVKLVLVTYNTDPSKITNDDLRQISLRALEVRNKLFKAGWKIELNEKSEDKVSLVQSLILHVLVEVIAKSSVKLQ